jgi:hypothetical protein
LQRVAVSSRQRISVPGLTNSSCNHSRKGFRRQFDYRFTRILVTVAVEVPKHLLEVKINDGHHVRRDILVALRVGFTGFSMLEAIVNADGRRSGICTSPGQFPGQIFDRADWPARQEFNRQCGLVGMELGLPHAFILRSWGCGCRKK